jgi:hypothetical protein
VEDPAEPEAVGAAAEDARALGYATHRGGGVSSFHCVGCGTNTAAIGEYYMVRDDAWPLAGDGGMLCIGCLEFRLGRLLDRSDFTRCPVNDDPLRPRSARLSERLGASRWARKDAA